MKNKRSIVFGGVILFLAMTALCPFKALAEESVTVPGIVEVEENHLYMVPVGTEDGVKKGDTVEIVRNDQKIADARLISVLPDNSMVEIVVMFVRTNILESDSVKFIKRIEKPGVRRTLGGTRTTTAEETAAVAPVRTAEERRRGLLGSEMHRYEEVTAVEGPLKEEIAQLKAGLVSVRGDYEERIDTILSAVERSTSKKEALDAEKQWKEKLISTEKRYQAQYRERKKLLENEAARLEAKVATLTNELKGVHEGTDTRVQQLLNDLKDREEEISSLKKAFVEEHLAGEKQWKTKLENLEAQYQNQLRTQKESLEESFATERDKLQNDINYLTDQVELVKESTGSQNSELQVRLKEREDLIDSLRKEQIGLESDLSRQNEQVRKLESDVATLKDVIAAAKRVHEKELEISRKPLEKKIENMSVEFISVKHDYERELNALRQGSKEDLLKNESQWVEKLAAVEQKYQNELSQLNAQNAAQVNQLRAELEGQKNVDELLKQNQVELTAKLKTSEQQLAQSQSDLNALETQLSVEKAARQEKIDLAKQPLEAKVAELSAALVSIQGKKGEDESLIEFLNNAMADLTADLEERDQKIVKLEEGLSLSQGEIEAMKKSHLERIKLAKEPLEAEIKSLNGEIVSLKQNYENQIKGIQESTSRGLLVSEEQWQAKLAAMEKEYLQERDASDQKITDLNKQVSLLKKDSNGVLTDLEAQLKKKQDAMNDLQKKNSGLTSSLSDKEDQLAKLKDDIAGLKKEISETQSSRSKWIASVKKPLEEEIKSLNNEIARLRKKPDEEWKAEFDQKDAELAKLRDEINDLRKDSNADDLTRSEWIKSTKQPLEDEIRALKEELVSVKKDYENKLKTESPREIAALKDQLREIKGNSEREMELLKNELEIERREVAKLEKGKSELGVKFDRDLSNEKRLELANSTLEAEVKKLNTQFEFLKDDHQKKMDFLRQQAMDDMRASEEKWKAQLAASEAQWKTKWAVREAELQKETAAEMESLENRIFGGKKEVQETIVSLNNRLNMLKNSSDSQIRELEADLAAQQYRLTVREAEFQERLMGVDQQWSEKMALAEKQYQEELEKQKRTTAQGFLDEKKELRETVIDLTRQFNELRANSSDRIKDLEGDLERKEYKLSLLENQSQQDLLGTEEKWQAKLAAIEEKRQRELLEQKQELEKQSLVDKEKLQVTIGDLNRQINVLRDQFKLDLALKEEAAAAEVALLERKYQDQLAGLKEGRSSEVQDLASKTGKQQDLIDSLQEERTSLKFDLEQRERELAKLRAEVDDLKKESKMAELSQSEKTRLSKQSLEATIGELTSQLAITKKRAEQERDDLEIRWKEKLKKTEEDYLEKIRLQRQNLEGETAALANKIGLIEGDRGNAVNEMRTELEDNQTLIRLLSKEKYELAASMEEKSRMIVMLNEEIIDLKEDLETYKDMLPLSSSAGLSSLDKIYDSSLVSGDQTWYDDQDASRDEYYAKVREAILSKFREFDFSDYEGKESVVKIDFELLANGSPKKGPEFLGTQDQGLKDLLTRCFEDALPFPPFPENLGKESQRFSLGISFKKQ